MLLSLSAAICRGIPHFRNRCSSICPVYIYTFVYGHVLPLLKIMYIYHRIPVYTIYCISTLYLIQYIVVTLLNRSKTVVGFFPIAAICRVLPNKSQPEHVFYPLPWQINSTLIISKNLPVRAQSAAFCCTLRRALSRTCYPK